MALNPSVYSDSHDKVPGVALTAREREILHLMTGDLTNAEIAEQLVVTPETVKWYTKQIYSKLDAHSRDEAVQIARDRHLLGQTASATDVDAHPSYIPLPPTPLVGRDAELSDICSYLLRDGIRLITLTGPPGIGKTRLSLHAAATVKDSFGNGAFFVGLASITNPLHVPGAIAGVLNLSDAGTMPLLEMLKNYLRGKHVLLVLDNFEQIMDAASTVTELLVAAPGLKLLVTSREVLRLSSEQQYPIPPLAMPDLRAPLVAGTISQVAAVDLFVQRARAIKHTFTLTNDNAPNVAQLCARLEGLPLAIELAAARIKLFSPAELLNGLSSRLNVLKANLRDLPSRQQTLRGAIDWSYALLTEDEKRLFSRMGVFHNGGTLTAASVICGAGLETDIVDLIESVIDKSLLTVREDGGTEPCFTMLEMMREYALEKLAETQELAAIKQAHAHYFAAMCADADAQWHTPPQTEWLDKLEREIDNIRAALDWCVTHDTETAALMMGQLWLLWSARGYHAEGDRWYEVVLAHSQRLSPLLKARVLACSGLFASYTGNLQRAVARLEECESLALTAEDDFSLIRLFVYRAFVELRRENPLAAKDYAEQAITIASSGEDTLLRQAYLSAALMDLGSALLDQGDYEGGKARLREAYAIRDAMGDALGRAVIWARLAWRLLLWGEWAEAERMSQDVIALAQKHRFHYVMAGASDTLLYVAVQRQDYAGAIDYGEQALALYRTQGNGCYRAACARTLGHAYYRLGNTERAVALVREGIEVARDTEQTNEVAFTLAQAALLQLDRDTGLRAARWLGTIEAAHAAIPYPSSLDRDQYSQVLETFRAQLGDDQFEAALAEGRALRLDQAAEEALANL